MTRQRLRNRCPQVSIGIGLDDISRYSPGRFGVSATAKGVCQTDIRFTVVTDKIVPINLWQRDFAFQCDTEPPDLSSLAKGEMPAVITGTKAP
jgi:hypothetical protein